MGTNFGSQIHLPKVYSELKKDYQITCFCDENEEYDVLHLQYNQKVESGEPPVFEEGDSKFKISTKKDVFLFKEGSVVCWGMDKHEENSWIDQVKPFAAKSDIDPTLEQVQ